MSRDEDIERWESEVSPTLQTLLATIASAGRSARNGPFSLMAASDQLFAAGRDTHIWLSTRRCPLPDINHSLVRTMRSIETLASILKDQSSSSVGPNLKLIDQEIEALVGMIANTMAVLSYHTGN